MARHGVAPLPETTGASPSYDPNFLAIPDAAWREDIEMMVVSVIRMARALTPIMVHQGGGAIVNITVLEAEQPRLVFPMRPTRLAVHGITTTYAECYGRNGIRMNSVLPGTMANGEIPPEAVRSAVPMGRLSTMAELGKTVAFLLGTDSGYITGQMIRVDGGINRGL
jgi:NAD(P)-dependent dehydrogenase (short-subunit alcohol dehydrogenase family)